jgi:hypothetical protein
MQAQNQSPTIVAKQDSKTWWMFQDEFYLEVCILQSVKKGESLLKASLITMLSTLISARDRGE